MRILAISGSLRSVSINSALLRAMRRLAPDDIEFEIFTRIGEIPLFNPDLEAETTSAVVELRRRVEATDALIIASPEYAHGMTGVIKNMLDWLVSFEPLAGKLCAVINASPRAHHADDALREVLKTMSVAIVENASVTIPLVGAGLDEDGMIADAAIAATIRASFLALKEKVE